MLSRILDVEIWRAHVATTQVVKLWREDLGKINPKAAEALADPAQYSNLFSNLDLALQAEKFQVWGLTLSLATSSTQDRPTRIPPTSCGSTTSTTAIIDDASGIDVFAALGLRWVL